MAHSNERPVSGGDWRQLVLRHAAAAGVDLPLATVDELAQHLEDIYAASRADGGSDADARRAAMTALEESRFAVLRPHASRDPRRPYTAAAEETARASSRRSLSVTTALRMAVRQFRHHSGFAIVTVLVLGLGVGAATTVFTIVNAVVLRPLPYAAPDRLITLWDANHEKGLAHDPISPVNFMDYRALPVFKEAAAWWRPSINLVDPGLDPVRINTIEVSRNLFETLGVRPQIGSGFSSGKFSDGDQTIVISDRLWRTRYSADPAIIGRQLSLNGRAFSVAGVMPPRFHYPDDVDIWQGLVWDLTQHSRGAHFMEAVARLADGKTIEEAQSAADVLALRLQKEFPATNSAWTTRLVPMLEDQLGYYRPALMVLFGAVALLLVIGCFNIASLLVTRALSREREIAVRVAMGASPAQLVMQLVAESLALSVAGVIAGVATAAVALPLIVSLTPVQIPRLEDARVDLTALAFAAAVVVGTTVFFGLVPAMLLMRRKLAVDLKSADRSVSRGGRRLYSALVAGEVALACALLVSSALLVRTVSHMTRTPTGIDADQVMTVAVQLSAGAYPTWRGVTDTQGRLLDEIRAQPGVQAAGGGNFLPLEVGSRLPFGILGEPAPARPEDRPLAQIHSVSDGYFEALGAQLADGRFFVPFDTPESAGVVVVNEAFAKRYLSAGRALGRVVTTNSAFIGPLGLNLKRVPVMPTKPEEFQRAATMPPTEFEVVGVVRDVRNVPLGQTIEPAVYFTTRQFPFRQVFLTVRASDPAMALAAVRRAITAVAPSVPIGRAQTWGERFAGRTAQARLLMAILMFFGALAGLLAALGVYGLFSWSVALRTRELAIRLTLGARPAAVGGLVLRQGVVLIAAGLTAGLVLIRVVENLLSRVLFEVTPGDVTSAVVASGLLVAAALVACIPPALRAMRVNPIDGLRVE